MLICEIDISDFFVFCQRYQFSNKPALAVQAYTVELFRFLILVALLNDASASSPRLLAPHLVDAGWKTLLLFPQLYLSLCRQLLGRDDVIERGGSGSPNTLIGNPAYQLTWKLYLKGFGFEPPFAIWPQAKPKVVPKPVAEKTTFFMEDESRKRYGVKADRGVLIGNVLERFSGEYMFIGSMYSSTTDMMTVAFKSDIASLEFTHAYKKLEGADLRRRVSELVLSQS